MHTNLLDELLRESFDLMVTAYKAIPENSRLVNFHELKAIMLDPKETSLAFTEELNKFNYFENLQKAIADTPKKIEDMQVAEGLSLTFSAPEKLTSSSNVTEMSRGISNDPKGINRPYGKADSKGDSKRDSSHRNGEIKEVKTISQDLHQTDSRFFESFVTHLLTHNYNSVLKLFTTRKIDVIELATEVSNYFKANYSKLEELTGNKTSEFLRNTLMEVIIHLTNRQNAHGAGMRLDVIDTDIANTVKEWTGSAILNLDLAKLLINANAPIEVVRESLSISYSAMEKGIREAPAVLRPQMYHTIETIIFESSPEAIDIINETSYLLNLEKFISQGVSSSKGSVTTMGVFTPAVSQAQPARITMREAKGVSNVTPSKPDAGDHTSGGPKF